MNTETQTEDRIEISWSYTVSHPGRLNDQGTAIDIAAAEVNNQTTLAYFDLARLLETAASDQGAALTRALVKTPVRIYRFDGGLTEVVVQVLGAVGGIAGIAGLLKDFLPIVRDWKKSNRNLSVTLKRNGTEISVTGAQSSAEVAELLKTSTSLAARKLTADPPPRVEA